MLRNIKCELMIEKLHISQPW